MNTRNWTVKPENLGVLVMGLGVRNVTLSRWLHETFPPQSVIDVIAPELTIIECRNRTMIDIVAGRLPSHLSHFLWIDDDTMPDERLQPFFEQQADIVGAMFDSQPAAWSRPTDVHCSVLMFSRDAVKKMKPPYFRDQYNEAHTQRIACECQHFRDQALALGLSVVRAGYCPHKSEKRWCR